MKKCLKTITKKHLWGINEISAKFSGTVGYYRTYVLKCTACDLIDDRITYTSSPPYHSSDRTLKHLLDKQNSIEKKSLRGKKL